MKREWFEESVRSWDPSGPWTDAELAAATEDLLAIGERVQARVFEDVPCPEALARRHALEEVEAALDGVACAYARALAVAPEPPRPVPERGPRPALPFVGAARAGVKLNVNSATEAELETLPGIGPAGARAVVASRRARTGFRSLADLADALGLPDRKLHQLGAVAYAAPRRAPALTSPELAAFLRAPSFAGYVRVLRASRLGLSSHGGAPEDGLRARILREVRALRAEVEQAPRPVPGISASRLLELEAQRGRAAAIRDRAIAGPMRAALLDDAEYPQFLLQLLQAAQASVHVVMFFMRFEDAARYPTDDLLDALVAARRRGADVRVILDRDAEGDAIGSRVVNDEAHRFLRKSGVPVVWDAEDRYTHSKLVVVDGAHVVVGSHNWTAGSFWAYDDLSAYVESKALAATYDARFETLWTTYGGSRLPGRSARVRGQARRRSAHAPQTRAAARGRRA